MRTGYVIYISALAATFTLGATGCAQPSVPAVRIAAAEWIDVEGNCIRPGGLTAKEGEPEHTAVLDGIDKEESSAREQSSGPTTSTFWLEANTADDEEQCQLIVDCLDENDKILRTRGVRAGKDRAKKVPCPEKTERVITWCFQESSRVQSKCEYHWR